MFGRVSLKEYVEALRSADDRRYAEVAIEKEKAIKIKETADLSALELAREIQTYKDEKANELREQISSERNLYPTKDELEAAIREVANARTASNNFSITSLISVSAVVIVILVEIL